MNDRISKEEVNLKLFERMHKRLPQTPEEFESFSMFISNTPKSNIERCFIEESIRDIEQELWDELTEADFWDGDGTDFIQY